MEPLEHLDPLKTRMFLALMVVNIHAKYEENPWGRFREKLLAERPHMKKQRELIRTRPVTYLCFHLCCELKLVFEKTTKIPFLTNFDPYLTLYLDDEKWPRLETWHEHVE